MSFKLSDGVSFRLIQIFQEAILTGVDGADLLRMVRVQSSEDDPETLELTPEYVQQVKDGYDRLLKQAEELQAAKEESRPHAGLSWDAPGFQAPVKLIGQG
mgnify:CR=1 FL=1